ncbi:hypothetical protein RND71_042072 [Anisodus tanguticus]|uniref:Peptidase A1 domain-containing protein n=1 Tax=Anisodus tanguticus TaxID=243964 RepID=A0AAE1UU99_9SOLA|nr:hypothetical protein RND71_042072 [Anisodus tanguticus]
MEARKRFMSLDPTMLPDPPMPSYTFTVYHRDVFEKSKFKQYDSLLENRLSRGHARASYLALVLESKNAQGSEMRELVPKSTATHFAGANERPVRVTFGCSKDQTGEQNFSASTSGIVGLGRNVKYSLPSQFGGNLMSMCLPSFYSGKSSILSFHTSKWKRATSAKLLPNHVWPSYYFVNLYKVFINDREVSVSPSWWNFKSGMLTGGIFVDTGTILTYFPHDFYIIFRDIFRAEVRDIHMVENPVESFDTCYNEGPNSRDLYFPVVTLYFGSVNSSTMLLLSQERVIMHYRGLYCLAFVGWDRDQSVLGMNQLQGVGLTFDTSANTLSFDLDACD